MKTLDDAEKLYQRLIELVGEEQGGPRFQKFLADEPNGVEHLVSERSEVWNYYFHKLGICAIVLKGKVFSIAMFINKNANHKGDVYKGYLPNEIMSDDKAPAIKQRFGREPDVNYADGRFGFNLPPVMLIFSFDRHSEQPMIFASEELELEIAGLGRCGRRPPTVLSAFHETVDIFSYTGLNCKKQGHDERKRDQPDNFLQFRL